MSFLMTMDGYNHESELLIEQLYNQYKYLMFKVAKDILKDEHLAEDALHEAFIKIAYNLDKIDDLMSNKTKRYLITITKNAALDIYRKRKVRREMYYDEVEDEIAMTYECEDTDIDNRVLNILMNLPVKYRDIFLLKFSSGYSIQEISKILNIPEGTIRQRIVRGKKKIEDMLINMEG